MLKVGFDMKRVKNLVLGFVTLLGFFLAGRAMAVLMVFLVPYPIPAPIWGLLLFYVFCVVHGRVPEYIRPTAHLLLTYMPAFFIPAGVSLLGFGDLLKQEGLTILLVLVVSTAAALVVTGLLMQGLQGENGGGGKEGAANDF